jgi:hypothetical protein
VASSADTRAEGIKKVSTANKIKNNEEKPNSAANGQFFILRIVARFIIVSTKTLIEGFFIQLNYPKNGIFST